MFFDAPCIVAAADTTDAVNPLPVYAVITAMEHCERHLKSLQHDDLDSGVCFLAHFFKTV